MQIIECKTKEQIKETYKVASQHYNLGEAEYMANMEEMMQAGDYRCIAAVNDQGEYLSILGFRVGRRLYCGKFFHLDNLIVGKDHRREGLAEKMVDWARDEARRLGCNSILADTYVENYPAHKLFMKEGLHIRGYHMREIL